MRCVRIVHGKGLRSGTRGPVIKNLVNALLHRTAAVLAFASARPAGGRHRRDAGIADARSSRKLTGNQARNNVSIISGHLTINVDIPAARFKAECLKLMDQVEKTREPITITKHGKPVARLMPVPAKDESLFGYMKSTVNIRDAMSPIDVEWSAESGSKDRLYERAGTKRARKK